MTTNDAGRWPVYEWNIVGGVPGLLRNKECVAASHSENLGLIVSDFANLSAENKRLREALTIALEVVEMVNKYTKPCPQILTTIKSALAEPTQ